MPGSPQVDKDSRQSGGLSLGSSKRINQFCWSPSCADLSRRASKSTICRIPRLKITCFYSVFWPGYCSSNVVRVYSLTHFFSQKCVNSRSLLNLQEKVIRITMAMLWYHVQTIQRVLQTQRALAPIELLKEIRYEANATKSIPIQIFKQFINDAYDSSPITTASKKHCHHFLSSTDHIYRL